MGDDYVSEEEEEEEEEEEGEVAEEEVEAHKALLRGLTSILGAVHCKKDPKQYWVSMVRNITMQWYILTFVSHTGC